MLPVSEKEPYLTTPPAQTACIYCISSAQFISCLKFGTSGRHLMVHFLLFTLVFISFTYNSLRQSFFAFHWSSEEQMKCSWRAELRELMTELGTSLLLQCSTTFLWFVFVSDMMVQFMLMGLFYLYFWTLFLCKNIYVVHWVLLHWMLQYVCVYNQIKVSYPILIVL